MLQRIKEWYEAHKRPIWQGVIVLLICTTLLVVCNGCSSFSGSDGDITSQFGLSNQTVSIGGDVCATSL